jgi:hypothetical protein
LAPTAEQGEKAPIGIPELNSSLGDINVDLTRDFGFVTSGGTGQGTDMSLGSTVWIDANWNGVQDADEPGIANVAVILSGGDLGALGGPFNKTATTGPNGDFYFSGLSPNGVGSGVLDAYVVTIPAEEMVDSGHVADAIRTYWGTRGLPSANVPVKALSTKDSDYLGSDTDRVDGDDDGEQSVAGDVTAASGIRLTLGLEPLNGPSGFTNTELAQTLTSTGYSQDDTDDANGDMTVDFGFIHQCYEICDVTGADDLVADGVLTAPDGRVTDQDLNEIRWKYQRRVRVTPPGAPASGDCGQTGLVVINDVQWCGNLVQSP